MLLSAIKVMEIATSSCQHIYRAPPNTLSSPHTADKVSLSETLAHDLFASSRVDPVYVISGYAISLFLFTWFQLLALARPCLLSSSGTYPSDFGPRILKMSDRLKVNSPPASKAAEASSTPDDYVYTGLNVACQTVRNRHPGLRVEFPKRLSVVELLERCASALKFDENPVSVPRISARSEALRQRLRAMAKENMDAEEARIARNRGPPNLTIQTHGLLLSADLPKPLNPGQRARLKEVFSDVLSISKTPSPHYKLNNLAVSNLPAVECTIALAAIDHEDPMPQDVIICQNALWDTGADMTYITDDMLSQDFRRFVNEDDVNARYQRDESTLVQISCMLEFSNKTIIQLDTVAAVIPRAFAPNGRSGVLLGQRGVIDSLEYMSVPQKSALKRDPTFPKDRWGYFNIISYCDTDGELRYQGGKVVIS